MDRGRMVHLVTVGSAFEAKVLAARLGSEGVFCELKGGVDGPYPFGPVHVYVEAAESDLARELLVPEPLDADPDDAGGVRRLADRPSLAFTLVLAGLLILAAASIARVVSSVADRPSSPPPATILD
jgi:hypothetical protein